MHPWIKFKIDVVKADLDEILIYKVVKNIRVYLLARTQ